MTEAPHAITEFAAKKPPADVPVALGALGVDGSVEGGELEGLGGLLGEVANIEGAQVSLSEESERRAICGGKAEIVTGVNLDGMLHISLGGEIEEFDTGTAEASRPGKFGKGTYFGLGPLEGETASGLVERLNGGSAHGHEAVTTGNFLVLERKDIKEVEQELRTILNIPKTSRVNNSFNNRHLTDLIAGAEVEGATIDGVIILMGQEEEAAEVVIMPEATSSIRITGVRHNGETIRREPELPRKPRLDTGELQKLAEGKDLAGGLEEQLKVLVEGEGSPLDFKKSLSIEDMTRMSVIPHDIWREMLVKRFGGVMDRSVGLEGSDMTLGEHTQMVLSIFEEQFADGLSDIDPELTRLLRTTLLLQDIGKPLASELHGDKNMQTDYNHDLAEAYLEPLDFLSTEKELIAELVGQDILGDFIKHQARVIGGGERVVGLERAVERIGQLADKAGVPPRDLLNMLNILYICDAGAYTSWSGYVDRNGVRRKGSGNLDKVFDRNDDTGTIDLNPKLQAALDALYAAFPEGER